MKAKDFMALLTELASLTTSGDVVALIEAEFVKVPACGHCGSEAFSRWSAATGMKRMCLRAHLQRAHRYAAGPPGEALPGICRVISARAARSSGSEETPERLQIAYRCASI